MPAGTGTAILAKEPVVSLVTFKRDGTPVATPAWCAGEDLTLDAIHIADH
jgi:hypothetical protein